MDLRQWGEPFEKKFVQLSAQNIQDVATNYHNWQREGYESSYKDVPEFCYSAKVSEIAEKGYSLVPSKYIEFINKDDSIDFDTKMRSLQAELKDILAEEDKSRSALEQVFADLGYSLK